MRVIGGDVPLGTIDTLRKPKKKILCNFRHPKSRVSPFEIRLAEPSIMGQGQV